MSCIRMFSMRLYMFAVTALLLVSAAGCGPGFQQLRWQGQRALSNHNHAFALDCFERAYQKRPGNVENLYDLGALHLARGKRNMSDGNSPAALRELDRAIWYFSGAIESHPGMQAALAGKNRALELKGQYDKALGEAEWASAFVGPRAREQVYLARELEERGDYDGALLRYRQAVAMEQDSAMAHVAFGEFLHKRGNIPMAIVHLRAAYKINPLEPGAAKMLTSLGEPLLRTTSPLEP